MAGYLYSDYVSAVGDALQAPVADATSATPFSDASYNTWLPRAIEAGEQRIYRELDLLFTRATDASGSLTSNQRQFTLPVTQGAFVVVEEVAVFSPAGTRILLLPVSKPYIDACWPTNTPAFTPSVPSVWCPYNQTTIFVGPAPDTTYGMEITGTVRPAALSNTNTSTVLTVNLPDLFLAATMVSWCGFQRDYGAQSDDPRSALSWEAAYQAALKSAGLEEVRKKFQTQGWSSKLPSPVATPAAT